MEILRKSVFSTEFLIIDIDVTYVTKLRTYQSQKGNFISNVDLVRLLIDNRNKIQRDDFNQLILDFLVTKAIEFYSITEIGQIIKSCECIETTDGKLSSISSLLDVNEQLISLFDDCDAMLKHLENIRIKFNEDPLDERHLELSLQIVNELIDIKYKYEPKKDFLFFLPDEGCVMRDIKDLCYNKDDYFKDESVDIHILHPEIPPKPLCISDFSKRYATKVGEAFGQREKLTTRIKNILERYCADIDIFKEFIQNADDADATDIRFIIDSRSLKTEKTFSSSFEKLQGPSLSIWNNSIFQDSDFNGISNIGEGSKNTDTEKIGRYGVGFNSVYQITDAPQFISDNSDYVIFDPRCKYMPYKTEAQAGLRMKDIQKRLKIYPNVIEGFELNSEEVPLKGSTFFRLPLRKESSDLCTTIKTPEDIKKMMLEMKKDVSEMLLFLKNVKKSYFL